MWMHAFVFGNKTFRCDEDTQIHGRSSLTKPLWCRTELNRCIKSVDTKTEARTSSISQLSPPIACPTCLKLNGNLFIGCGTPPTIGTMIVVVIVKCQNRPISCRRSCGGRFACVRCYRPEQGFGFAKSLATRQPPHDGVEDVRWNAAQRNRSPLCLLMTSSSEFYVDADADGSCGSCRDGGGWRRTSGR